MDKLLPVLQNSIALLRPLQAEDEAALQLIADEKELWTYGLSDLSVPGELRKYIAAALADRQAGICAVWTITDKATGQIAGCTRLTTIDWKHRRGEVGATWIGNAFQGTGLNRAMKHLILQYGFDTLKLNRIELKADERNIRSHKAILGIGATQEGTLRQHMITHDGYVRNTVYYSILRREWPAIQQKYFANFVS